MQEKTKPNTKKKTLFWMRLMSICNGELLGPSRGHYLHLQLHSEKELSCMIIASTDCDSLAHNLFCAISSTERSVGEEGGLLALCQPIPTDSPTFLPTRPNNPMQRIILMIRYSQLSAASADNVIAHSWWVFQHKTWVFWTNTPAYPSVRWFVYVNVVFIAVDWLWQHPESHIPDK